MPRELGDRYEPAPAPPSEWAGNNRNWINSAMDEGREIFDREPARDRANFPSPTSEFYMIELDEISARNYPKHICVNPEAVG